MEDFEIMYIHPDSKTIHKKFMLSVGLPALMNNLKKCGFKVKGLNLGLERHINHHFNLEKYLSDKTFNILAIDLHWYHHISTALKIASICKRLKPKIYVIIGGYTSSIFAKDILERFNYVDFIIKGEAEEPLLKLTKEIFSNKNFSRIPNLLYRLDGKYIENPITYVGSELDSLNFADLDFLHNENLYYSKMNWFPKFIPICVGRGCRYNCSFCDGSKFSQKIISNRDFILIRKPENVIEDIERFLKKGVSIFKPNLDIYDIGENFWIDFFKILRKKKLKIGIHNEFCQIPNLKFAEDMSRSVNCMTSSLIISPLTGDEEARFFNGKKFSNDEMIKIIKSIKKFKIPIEICFSPGLPKEDNKSFNSTINFMNEISKISKYGDVDFSSSPIIPDPASKLNLLPQDFSIINKIKKFDFYYKYSSNRNLFRNLLEKYGFVSVGYYQKNSSVFMMQFKFWMKLITIKILRILFKLFLPPSLFS